MRRQARQAPDRIASSGPYPKHFNNGERMPLTAQPPLREYPIVPSPRDGAPGGNYTGYNGQYEPGRTRAIYNAHDRTVVDVAYHDRSQPPRGPREGRTHARTPYAMATYHPAATYTDLTPDHDPDAPVVVEADPRNRYVVAERILVEAC